MGWASIDTEARARLIAPYRNEGKKDDNERCAPPWVVEVVDTLLRLWDIGWLSTIHEALLWCEQGDAPMRAEQLLTIVKLWPGDKTGCVREFLYNTRKTGAGRAKGAKPRPIRVANVAREWPPIDGSTETGGTIELSSMARPSSPKDPLAEAMTADAVTRLVKNVCESDASPSLSAVEHFRRRRVVYDARGSGLDLEHPESVTAAEICAAINKKDPRANAVVVDGGQIMILGVLEGVDGKDLVVNRVPATDPRDVVFWRELAVADGATKCATCDRMYLEHERPPGVASVVELCDGTRVELMSLTSKAAAGRRKRS